MPAAWFLLLLLFLPANISVAATTVSDQPAGVPDVLVGYSGMRKGEHAVVVEKATQKLFLYAYDGRFRRMQTRPGSSHPQRNTAGKLSILYPKGLGDSKPRSGEAVINVRLPIRILRIVFRKIVRSNSVPQRKSFV